MKDWFHGPGGDEERLDEEGLDSSDTTVAVKKVQRPPPTGTTSGAGSGASCACRVVVAPDSVQWREARRAAGVAGRQSLTRSRAGRIWKTAAVPVIAVVGPTASGKSDLALELAQRLDGEIVNADAMQLYRGMDIGTAKLTPRGAPGDRPPSARRPRRPPGGQRRGIPAGGPAGPRRHPGPRAPPDPRRRLGLYVRAALDRLEIPPTDPEVRGRLQDELAREGIQAMHARLVRVDPVAARAIQPNHDRRVVRALEVIELTGRPFSATCRPVTTRSPPSPSASWSRGRSSLSALPPGSADVGCRPARGSAPAGRGRSA